ncbi:MAG: membrane dipeptidase [Gemmatimonadetes bacterium]|nr:membrane dipeptidase [Gemmatimonadota bacterium]
MSVSARTTRVHQDALVWDAHCDSLLRAVVDDVDLGVASTAQGDLPAWKAGGIDAQVFAVWVDTIYGPYHAARRALEQIDAYYLLAEKYPAQIELARSAAEVRRIVAAGKLAAMIAIEGGLAIQNNLRLLRIYAQLGATSMTLTHTASIDWVDSSTDVERSGGLSPFGRDVIGEMNRLRMIVDCSHVSDKTIEQVVALSDQPIIASHSSCRALADHPRNLPDRLIEAIAKTGGVVGINFYNEFMDQRYRDVMASKVGQIIEVLNKPTSYPPEDLDRIGAERHHNFFRDVPFRPPFERILEHIDHAVKVAGVDHVGIGGDLDAGAIPTPLGMDGFRDYPKITEGLLARGYSETDVAKIMGGNFLRVFEAVRGG